jgi:site-specific recombinase XerD
VSHVQSPYGLLPVRHQRNNILPPIMPPDLLKQRLSKRGDIYPDTEGFPDDEYLFQVHSNRATGKPVSRQMVARKFKEVGETLNIALSTHSMRKTRGFAMFNDGKPIEMISKVLNYSSPSVTMSYLGITKDEVLATYDEQMQPPSLPPMTRPK